jgi:hypothetical protein
MSISPMLLSHIVQVTFSEFEIGGHYDTCPNEKEELPSTSFSRSE